MPHPQPMTIAQLVDRVKSLRSLLDRARALADTDLKARALVIEVEDAIEQAGQAIQAAEQRLDQRFNAWQG